MQQLTERQTWYREEYLASDHWRKLRLEALQKAAFRCQVCNSAKELDVHHRTYERLGNEELADLTVLCRRCHDLYHGPKPGSQPKPKPSQRGKAKSQKTKHRPEQKPWKNEKIQKERAPLVRHALVLGPASTQEVAVLTGLSIPAVGNTLAWLRARGEVKRLSKGAWSLGGSRSSVDRSRPARDRKVPEEEAHLLQQVRGRARL